MSFDFEKYGAGFYTGGEVSYQTMIWDPTKIGAWDDSFPSGDWSATNVTKTHIDGDHIKLEISGGQTEGYVAKTGISVAVATYPYLCIRVKGDTEYFIEVYTGTWKRIGPFLAHPKYRFETFTLADYGISGTITQIRLGVKGAATDLAYYDYFEFTKRPPEYVDALQSLNVHQRENLLDTFKLFQRRPPFTPAWVSPTGFEDLGNEWANEENIYDENTGTAAQDSIAQDSWGDYVSLTIEEITSNKLRFYAYYNAASINKIDVDVYLNGAWVDVYEGAYANSTWVEKEFTKGLVTEARVRFYNDATQTSCNFYEFDFRSVEPNPFTKGHSIRIVVGRDDSWEKIFAGVIEESIRHTDGLREVTGRCFQVKIMSATKIKTLDDRELSLAVKDVLEDFSELSYARLAAPSPSINVTKIYEEAHCGDILDQLVALPSKQSPFETWRWKLGYGHDLRFRSALASAVLACTTAISEGTNILVGVKKGADIYELYNKVVAISGEVWIPFDDIWTHGYADWAIEMESSCVNLALSDSPYVAEGANAPFCGGDLIQYFRINNDLGSAVDTTPAKKLRIYVHTTISLASISSFTIEFLYGQNYANSYRYTLNLTGHQIKGQFHLFEIDLDDPKWAATGSPTKTGVDYIAFEIGLPIQVAGGFTIDGWHFVVENMEATSTDPASIVDHDRVYVYKDAKINNPDQLQDFADGLLKSMKNAADRILVPVIGEPDLQRGRKVTATSETFELSGTYIIAEAEHIIDSKVGYIVLVMLGSGRYSLPADLRRTMGRELAREKLGGVKL